MKKYKINYSSLFNRTQNGGKIASVNTYVYTRSIKKDFLIIIPAGDKSLHTTWFHSNIYDLYTIYYGEDPKVEKEYQEKSEFFMKKKGPKWQLFRAVLNNFDWKKYKYIWIPDDDLEISKKDIEEFLLTSQSLKLQLSQVSLRPPRISLEEQINIYNDWKEYQRSSTKYIGFYKYHQIKNTKVTQEIIEYISYKMLLQQYPKEQKIVRYTNFVEIMCPLLTKELLEKMFLLLDYDDVQSGFGLDSVLPYMLNNKNIAVIDYISAIHTRPVGNFQNKKTGNFKVLSVVPEEEKEITIKRSGYSIDKNDYNRTLKTITLAKPKLAFLFLTREDVNYPKIWEKFLKNNMDRCNIYMHPKEGKKVKSFFKKYIIDTITNTSWGRISIVKAMNNLLKEAIKDGTNQKFIFVSESCLPLHNFDKIYSYLEKTDKSIFSLGNASGQHMKRFEYLKKPEKLGINKDTFYKAETWSILSRKHVELILDNSKYFLETFNDVYVPEEHFNPTLILLKDKRESFINQSTTYVHWNEIGAPHPYFFGPKLDEKDKERLNLAIKNKSLFARKFKYNKKNNVEEFFLKLIE